jgi:anti-sigma-K factor RskA
MMAYSEDDIALAAEYALGTLDADERAEAEAKMSIDKDFAAMVEAWQHKLGVLNQMVGSVEPRPEVWNKIKSAISLSEAQAALVLPETPPFPLRKSSSLPRWRTPNVIKLSAQARRWRNLATFATAIAAALIAMIAVRLYRRVCFRGHPSEAADAVVEVKIPSAPTPRSSQYVAVLQKEGGAPVFILTVDAATRNFTVRKVAAPAEPGKRF